MSETRPYKFEKMVDIYYFMEDGTEQIIHRRDIEHPDAKRWIDVAKRNEHIHYRIIDNTKDHETGLVSFNLHTKLYFTKY